MTSIINLDFSKLPSGSFAVAFTPRVAKDARFELGKLAPHAHNLIITTETLDGVRATVPGWNALNDMLDLLFASGSLTLKVFTNESKGASEREIVKKLAVRLGPELTKLTPYATLQKLFAIQIELAPETGRKMRIIDSSSDMQTLSTLHMIVCTTCKSVGVQLDMSTLKDLNYDLRRLNSMGVFHSDVHLGNVMQRENGRACLIDFGSVFIDDAVPPDEVPYKRGRFPHPFVHAFFTGTQPRIESQTLALALVHFIGHFAYMFMDVCKNEPAFVRYVLHKKDMYNLAYTWWQHRALNGSGILGCFRPSVQNDTTQHINVKPSKRDEERGGNVQYRQLLKNHLTNDLLAEMLYFDRPDYQEFARNYVFSYCGAGGKAKKINNQPAYVALKSTNRVHRIRMDDSGRKCVLSQGRLVLLSSIRGQYRQVVRPASKI